jgi:hypothetical protein
MKVAVSIPDPIFRAAERTARRMRIPRSQLYAKAVEAFVRRQERPDITARLDAVYGESGNQPDAVVLEYNRQRLLASEWRE